MIHLHKLKIYPFSTKEIGIPNTTVGSNYSIFVYPENTSLSSIYPVLKIKKQFVRKVVPVFSRYPKVIPTAKSVLPLKNMGLIPIRNIKPSMDNVFVDTTPYLDAVDATFHKGSYRRAAVSSRIKQFLNGLRGEHRDRKKVLLYVINLDDEFPRKIHFRRIWPILEMIKEEDQFPFDYFLVNIISGGISSYSLFSKEQQTVPYVRVRSVLSSLQSRKPEFVETDESEEAASKLVEKITFEPSLEFSEETTPIENEPGNILSTSKDDIKSNKTITQIDIEKTKIKNAISDYLKNIDPKVRKRLINNTTDKDSLYSLATKSILYKVSGKLNKANSEVEKIPVEKLKYMFQRVKDELITDLVDHSKPQNNSRDVVNSKINIPAITENKEPSHLYNKRQIDFNESFSVDLKKSFQLLQNKDMPLKLISFTKKSLTPDKGDLSPSLYDQYSIVLKDKDGKTHPVEIQIPRLMEDGTFILNGSKKFLTFQIILDPIFFLKADRAKLETLFAPVTVFLKRTKRKTFFQILFGGYKLPLIALLGFAIGLDNVFKLFGISYKLVEETPNKNQRYFTLSDGSHLVLTLSTKSAEFLVSGLHELSNIFTKDDIFTKEIFERAIVKFVGNRNCTWKISWVLENIMDPVTVQVLKTKLLPFTFVQCMKYICDELAKGRVDDRNDLSKQRIRSSEVFVQQIQKLILGSYTDYREKKLSGFEDVEYRLDVTEAIKQVVNSKLVDNLENINPTEELSCFTRIKPIGEGGIPDANAMVESARNIHPTYYGNVDAMDTPEGCLCVDVFIRTSVSDNKKIGDVVIGDSILWIDDTLYKIVNKVTHKKLKMIIRTKYDNIECSKEHRWPVLDTVDNTEKILRTSEIENDIKRYKLIRYVND